MPPVRQPVSAASLMRFTAFILIARSSWKARAEAGSGGNCTLCIIVAWLTLLPVAPLQFYDTHVM
jgi:hypothetical protein